MLAEYLTRLCQLDNDYTTIRGVPPSLHETLLFQAVSNSGDRAGLDHNVLGNLGRGEGTNLVDGEEAVKLRGTHLILFIQLLGVELSRLQEPADLVDDLPDLILLGLVIHVCRGRLVMVCHGDLLPVKEI